MPIFFATNADLDTTCWYLTPQHRNERYIYVGDGTRSRLRTLASLFLLLLLGCITGQLLVRLEPANPA